MIDWQAKAQEQQDEYLNDLMALIKIPSVRDDTQATDEYPLGPKPAQALHAILEMAQQDGFKTKNIDNVVGYVECGEGDETLAILAHVDVMPAGDGWQTDPFDPVIKDGNIYGRGTSDDKGPGLAAYYALKTLKSMGVKFNQKVRMIFGTDEESNWTGMKRYFEVEPAPTYGFSPDASFPLINGEKGNVSLKLNFDATATGTVALTRFDAGLRPNMVPGKATASVHTTAAHQMASAFDDYLAGQPVSGSAHVDGDNVNFEVIGKAAHGMEPEKGNNAGTYLAQFLMQFDFAAAAHDFLTILGRDLHLDTRLHNLKMNFVDEIMGELTVNVGIMRYDAQVGGMIDLNFRYPKGLSADALVEQLTVATTGQQLTITRGDAMEPHYVDPQDPIVQTLMNAYRDQTGDVDSQPEVVGGGTYGRMMTRGVAFGALFPDTTNTMHQANEFQPVNQLVLSMAIYMQAIYELSVKK